MKLGLEFVEFSLQVLVRKYEDRSSTRILTFQTPLANYCALYFLDDDHPTRE